MSLLTIVQNVSRLVKLPVPQEVADSTDVQVQQLFALANEEGQENARSFDWEALTRQHTFETTASAEQPYAIPDDLDHFVPDTFFDRTAMRPVLGPITGAMWQAIQAQPQLNLVFYMFRERAGEYLVTPNAAADHTLAFEYITKNWATDSTGEPIPYFTSDADTPVLPERIFELGIRWRFEKSNGLDYSEDYKTYRQELQKYQARDGGSGTLNLAGRGTYAYLSPPNVSVGNFPG